MKTQNKLMDIMVMGFALFAIFFGAGNLIFPPYVGQVAGSNWQSAMWGFLITDPILPVFGIIAAALIGGKAGALGQRVSPYFAKGMTLIAMFIIGPLFAIPRTAATVHEIAILPWFPDAPPYITSFIFLGLTLLLVVKEGGIIEIIGKYLTPILLVVLTILISKCIVHPIGPIASPNVDLIGKNGSFFFGFSGGYQTMDALGAILTIGIVTADMVRRGYNDAKERFRLSLSVAAVAGVLLLLVYGGLVYVGATASSVLPAGAFSRSELLVGISNELLGSVGVLVLGICVAVACLTTSTGLTTMFSEFCVHQVFKEKISYHVLIVFTIVVSFVISIFGTSTIISYAGPILEVIYPIVVVLIFFTLFDKFIINNEVYIGAVAATLIISLIATLSAFVPALTPAAELIKLLPFHEMGFPWIVPSIICAIIGSLIGRMKNNGKRMKLAKATS